MAARIARKDAGTADKTVAVVKKASFQPAALRKPIDTVQLASGHDIGTVNFAQFHGEILPDDVACPETQFPFILDPVYWQVDSLKNDGAENTYQFIAEMAPLMVSLPLVAQGRVKTVEIEQQLANKNPIMFGVSGGLNMFYIQQQRHVENHWPLQISNVGACAKFGLLLLKAPEGDANKIYRKKLSIRIVLYLITQWQRRGLLAKEWCDMFRQTTKSDDLADAMLMTYTEELRRRQYPIKWRAIELLFTFLVSEAPFQAGGKCPLGFSARGRRLFNAYLKAQDKKKLRAIMENNARLIGRKKRRNETNEQYLAEANKQRRLTFNNSTAPPAPAPAAPEFPACTQVAANQVIQAANRKERGPIADPRHEPVLHPTERNPYGRVTLQSKRPRVVEEETDVIEEPDPEEKEYEEACVVRIELDAEDDA